MSSSSVCGPGFTSWAQRLCVTFQLPQEHQGCESQLCYPALDVVARQRDSSSGLTQDSYW